MSASMNTSVPLQRTPPKGLEVVAITPPPVEQRVVRNARFAAEGEKKTRYTLPQGLESASPVGYRTRISMTEEEASQALRLLSLKRPSAFVAEPEPVTEQALFEESALGIMLARQSTNYRGHKQVTLGPEDSEKAAELLRQMGGVEAPVLDHAGYTHVVFSRPYRTAFTLLLTFVGHRGPLSSLATVPARAWRKRFRHASDIPTIGYLQHLHIGILADTLERAAVIASEGQRRAQIFMNPFCDEHRKTNAKAARALAKLCGLSAADRMAGWRPVLVSQVGDALPAERLNLGRELYRKIGANLVAFRSERIQPGVNAEERAPAPYQSRQDMDVPQGFTVQAGRACYNAFAHWTGCDREEVKELLLLDRIDVLTERGKERLRAVRDNLSDVTDRVVENIPPWADLATGKALSRNAERGRKAFALVGQRIYLTGVSPRDLVAAGVGWEHALRGCGAAAARSSLYAELMGCVNIPEGCDLLAGICMMAGPVNQNDIGKAFYGHPDLLEQTYPNRDATSLLVWTLKAKTVADPIGNEEQLLNANRKGALVDLRPGPHEVVQLKQGKRLVPMRQTADLVNAERAYADLDNFVTDPEGQDIAGNRGISWPRHLSSAELW